MGLLPITWLLTQAARPPRELFFWAAAPPAAASACLVQSAGWTCSCASPFPATSVCPGLLFASLPLSRGCSPSRCLSLISFGSTFTQPPKTAGGTRTSKPGAQPESHSTEKRKQSLPEGIKGVGSPDVCAQHVQRAVFAAILEEVRAERDGITCQAWTLRTCGRRASPRPSPGEGSRGPPCPPGLVILGS